MRNRSIVLVVSCAVSLLSCERERPFAESPSTPTMTAAASSAPAAPPLGEIVHAPTRPLHVSPCDRIVVAVTQGAVTALDQKLGAGDTILLQGTRTLTLEGKGQAVVVSTPASRCSKTAEPAVETHVVRSGEARELAWAGGQMKARLDLEKDVLPEMYVGRLDASLPVPEHAHPGSWEVLCALQASGIFTLQGEDRHLGDGTCVVIPPDTKHAWKPDPGSRLVAVQVYAPPGPEERFKKLAAADANGSEADAGPR